MVPGTKTLSYIFVASQFQRWEKSATGRSTKFPQMIQLSNYSKSFDPQVFLASKSSRIPISSLQGPFRIDNAIQELPSCFQSLM